jgi:hypothetical protein
MKFKNVAHLYLGCQCVVSASDYYEAGKGKLVRIDIEDDETLTVSGNTMHDKTQYCVEADFDDAKPILRPLSSMTEAEAKELELADVQIGLLAFGHRLQMHMTPDQFKLCLDKNFDLFGLIESGEAIDASTINTKP